MCYFTHQNGNMNSKNDDKPSSFWGVYDFQTNPYSLKHVLAVAGADANSKLLLAASSVNRRASTWGTTHQQPCLKNGPRQPLSALEQPTALR
jgi:hypothetical protein